MLDCSLALAWLLQEKESVAVEESLERIARAGAIVPGIWPLEITNVLALKSRRASSTSLDVDALVADLKQLPILIDAETSSRAWVETLALARLYRLTTYDASYLELAIRLRLPLATLDRELQEAATVAGVNLMGI